MEIPKLKVTKRLLGSDKVDNGTIKCEIFERFVFIMLSMFIQMNVGGMQHINVVLLLFSGFNLEFSGEKDLIHKRFALSVKDFPCKIFVPKSSWKVRSNAVDIKLRVSVSISVFASHVYYFMLHTFCLFDFQGDPIEVVETLREERTKEEPEPAGDDTASKS